MDEKLMWVINIASEDAPDTTEDKVQGEACCCGGGGSASGGSGESGGSPGAPVSLPGPGTPRSSELLLLLSNAPDGTGLVHVVQVTGTEMLHLPQPQSSLSGFLSAPTSGDAGEPQKS